MSRNLKRLCTRMGNNEKLELYEDQPIRTAWNETEEETFEKFKDSTSEISSMTEVTAFTIGFKLGLRLTAEAFIGGNDEQKLISE